MVMWGKVLVFQAIECAKVSNDCVMHAVLQDRGLGCK